MSTPSLRWRKKPIVIEAVRITPADHAGPAADGAPFMLPGGAPPQWLSAALEHGTLYAHPSNTASGRWAIRTTEGTMIAAPGDWIICGVRGELYPCKPDIFAATYEPA